MFFINIYFYDFLPICRFTGYSGSFICSCDYLHQGIYGNLWTTCSKRKVPRPHSPFGKRKTRENILRVLRAQVRKEVFVTGVQREITETFNSFNATLLHSQAEFFFFFPFYFFLAGKFYFENTTSFIQRHGSKIKKNFFRVHDCFGSYPSPRQLFCPTDSPGLAPTLPLIRHFALSEKLVLGEV